MNEFDIFSAAIEIEAPDDRERFLAEACGDDHRLRQRVEALLRSAREVDSFLESRPLDLGLEDTVVDRAKLPLGTTVGPYKLLQQIGEGGMGVVYMAEQVEPVERVVAIKVIKPGMDTRQVIARFEAERQALALMDHPNIAKVLDAGTAPEGQPYFVMELVKGPPLTQYCDEHRLTPRERLELFLPVCHAVQHAHQKGIIHRDLKPTNVLVAEYDERPVAKIIDFGVAKAVGGRLTERTLFTEYGQIVGTIEYMSPEQAKLNQLDVDTRSDVYSLGILLYELLTGTTPFEKARLRSAAFDEMLRIIREEEPPKPSTRLTASATLASVAASRNTDPARLRRIVRGELDWIVMKCLEKDRSRRYETASSLALDIQRYLAGEPVAACPPSAMYRFQKFARRNKGFLTAAVAVMLVLVVGAAVSTWLAVRAQANYQLARQAVDAFFTRFSESEDLRNQPALQPLRRELLEAALPFYDDLLHVAPSDAELRAEQAATCFRIAILIYETGSGENWLPWFEQGVAIIEELLEVNYDVSRHARLASGQRWLGASFEGGTFADFQEIGRVLERARVVWERLVHRYPDVLGFQHDLAALNYALGIGEAIGGQQARVRFTQAIDIWQKLVDARPDVPHYRAPLSGCLATLTSSYVRMRRTSDAERAVSRAVENAERLVDDFPTPGHREILGSVYKEHAYFLEHVGRLEEAEQAWRKSLRIFDELRRIYPTVPRYLLPVMIARIELSMVLWETGQRDEAREHFDEVLALGAQIGEDQLLERFWFAWFLADCVDPDYRNPQRAAKIADTLIAAKPHVGEYWITRGIAYYRLGRHQDAIDAIEKSMPLVKYYQDSAHALFFLAMARHKLNQTDAARKQYDAAVVQLETEYEWLWPRRNRAEAQRVLGLPDPGKDQADPQPPTAHAGQSQRTTNDQHATTDD